MKVILLGAPGAGKYEFAAHLADELGSDVYLSRTPEDMVSSDIAVGELSDYRTEIQLAAARVTEGLVNDKMICTHSLLDNVAYSSQRVDGLLAWDVPDEELLKRWLSVLQVVSLMAADSVRYDHLFFLRGGDAEFEALLEGVLDVFELSYLEVTDAEECATIIRNG